MAAPALHPPERVVLVVDDEDAVRRVITRILTDAGFRVLEARDGEEALGLLTDRGANAVWLVVSDIVMPQLAGEELAEIIAQKWPSVRVLLLSAYVAPRNGFTGSFLQKPFAPDALVAVVRALLPASKVPAGAEQEPHGAGSGMSSRITLADNVPSA
jgi:two-component system, cell cycle sensor histidine kinase and response regulator CckA